MSFSNHNLKINPHERDTMTTETLAQTDSLELAILAGMDVE